MSLTDDEILVYNQELQYLSDQYKEFQKEREPISIFARDLDIKMDENRKRFRTIIKRMEIKEVIPRKTHFIG